MKAFLSHVADKHLLATIGFGLGIDTLLTDEPFKAGACDKIMERAMEAILGAVFKDSNKRVEIVETAMDGLGCFNGPGTGVVGSIALLVSSPTP